MNNNKYINPSSKLLKDMAKLSKYELIVLSKNYKKFIDNIKTKDKIKQDKIKQDKIKQDKIEKDRDEYDY